MAESDSDGFEDSTFFERSRDERDGANVVSNRHFDEALDVSASLDGSQALSGSEPRQLQNEQFDAALDVSASLDMKSPAVENKSVRNNPFDEIHDASGSDDSIDTTASAKDAGAGAGASESTMAKAEAMSKSTAPKDKKKSLSPQTKSSAASDDSDESDEVESSGVVYKNAYKAADYAHLNVGAEVRELFNYIDRYRPHQVELETTLMCFIPDYIPAVGEMDAFLKVPRPDGKEDELGLKVLDEPSASQSDPTVLELQLRAISKKVYGDVNVRSIENAHKSPQEIERWIKSIQELHRNKPPPRVTYTRSMPDIEPLMEAWPEDFERTLSEVAIPRSSEMDMSLEEYVRMCCAILDIPVYDNPVESLHVMFTLYSAFKNNPHFLALQQKQLEDVGAAGAHTSALAAERSDLDALEQDVDATADYK